MSPLEVQIEARRLRWYQTIDLGHGVVTNGVDNTPARLQRIQLPASLAGQTVLDVGAWDGFFSFEAERRGAARVLATDFYSWTGQGWGTKQAFELARCALHSKVEDLTIDIPDISPGTVGTFDVVLFLGVLYHLEDPLAALRRLAAVTRKLLIVETVTDLLHVGRPAMAFYPGRELNSDPTNWWAPNVACLEGMLQTCGFGSVECVYRHSLVRRAGFALREALARRSSFLTTLSQGRAAFHARK